jgi:hypothetical protein
MPLRLLSPETFATGCSTSWTPAERAGDGGYATALRYICGASSFRSASEGFESRNQLAQRCVGHSHLVANHDL